MELTECTCPEPECPRCLASLSVTGCERRHYTDESGDYCCLVNALKDPPEILTRVLLQLSPELQALEDAAAAEEAAAQAAKDEALALAAVQEAELARLKEKRLAGELLTAEETQFLQDVMLGL